MQETTQQLGQQTITREFVRQLAKMNGLEIPDERLELVAAQYRAFLRQLEQLDSLPLPMEAEPSFVVELPYYNHNASE